MNRPRPRPGKGTGFSYAQDDVNLVAGVRNILSNFDDTSEDSVVVVAARQVNYQKWRYFRHAGSRRSPAEGAFAEGAG
jgi:hypothetical protein